MNVPESAAPARPVLLAALVYSLLFAASLVFLPHPQTPSRRILLMALWLAPGALLALAASVRKAAAAQSSERLFWLFLSATCFLHTLGVGLLLWRGLFPEEPGLATALGLAAYHCSYAVLIVGLLVPLDRPTALGDLRKAALEWLLVAGSVAFLAAYFVLLPSHRSPWPSFVLYTAEELLPAALMLRGAWLTSEPHRSVFRLLALGFALGALIDVRANWLYVSGRYDYYGIFALAWALPDWSVFAAARVRTGASWLLQASPARRMTRTRLAALALLIPPLVDLGVRGLRLPGDEAARSLLTLAASTVLALLVSLRLRQAGPTGLHPRPDDESKSGSPELGRLASGAAHEINNPLMAVVVAAELALARGGAEAPLRSLQEAVHEAATAVRRFQLVASGRDPEAKP